MSKWKIGLIVLGCGAGILGLMFFFQGADFFLYKTFAPAYENVRRETFENTKSYVQGTIEQIDKWQFEYIKADESSKNALAHVILQSTAAFDEENLPPRQKAFLQELRDRIYQK